MADIIWVVVFLCVLIASCFGMYYFQGENKQKFVCCFLLVALSFGVLAFRLLDIAYTVINAAIKTACNEFDPIYDECRASDFFWATAAVEFAGIDKMTLKEVLAAV